MRCFFGVALPAEGQTVLHQAFAGLRAEFSGRRCSWVPPENLHLTLRFLGDCDRARLHDVTERARDVVSSVTAPRLQLAEAGLFPARRNRPLVLWAGVQGDLAPLGNLVRGLERAACQAGFAPERRSWRPHVTLARLVLPADGSGDHGGSGGDSGAPLRLPSVPPFAWSPGEFHLFQSQPGPLGVRYPRLRSFAFFRPIPPSTLAS